MKLQTLKLSGFQSFGMHETKLNLEDITYLIGPNGSGKTAVLQALCRMFATLPDLRNIKATDFHVPINETAIPEERKLSIEAVFSLPEIINAQSSNAIPTSYSQMYTFDINQAPIIIYRLEASLGIDGEIESYLYYVHGKNEDGALRMSIVPRTDRHHVQVHYLPAQRDPKNHISYATHSLIGRLLRATNWDNEKTEIELHTNSISTILSTNSTISNLGTEITNLWDILHKGNFFQNPKINFSDSEIHTLLRHLNLVFDSTYGIDNIEYSHLSDGQKSLLYFSLVIAYQKICNQVISGKVGQFDPNKLKPAVFNLIAVEEPENSLAPHYLGRINNELQKLTKDSINTQAVIATHAPSMLYRADPLSIRFLRLSKLPKRTTYIRSLTMPHNGSEAYKYVQEAITAYPEIFFSRLVVLGEGDSEMVVLPKIFEAKGVPVDENSITIAPLGGRHVNHFWRLLFDLEIPFVTLLDLDIGRYNGGWGRIKYVHDKWVEFQGQSPLPEDHGIPLWNDSSHLIINYLHYLSELEKIGVYFSYPLDLDFSMISAYEEAFGITQEEKDKPIDEDLYKAVFGKSVLYKDSETDINFMNRATPQYSSSQQLFISPYKNRFATSGRSKPFEHYSALGNLTNAQILESLPESLTNLVDKVKALLESVSE
ncbi:AAA family ATPase [Wohlfahrtiimonas chitiniclastica]|uniref:ATP-dependent nuclease n=1 Tax=Wohlfahrtiimonas chitiniclastica TaxID=400946 RepID=UPI001BD00ACB|nr:AAA family ATPase [Wohlfahrtiimonas chitiniclastica]MBS7829407.1 AAA family ATPase [Wohlfahrtiimonas chitiniclastica]